MSGKALDDLDDFFAAEAVVGEFDELPCPGEHRPPLGSARHGDPASAPELQQAFLPEHVQGPQDGVLVHAQHCAYPLRRGTQVTTTTVTFPAISQPQHITAPPDAVSYRKAARMTTHHH